MVNIALHDTKTVTTRVVIVLAITSIIFMVLAIAVITGIVNNFYDASYYIISSMFDAVGISQSVAISALITPFTSPFYVVVGISIIAGLIKIAIVGFVIASVINLITNLDIRSKIAGITRKSMKNHVILCGYSLLTERLVAEFKQKGTEFIIIDRNPTKTEMARELGFRVLHENFTTDIALKNAYIDKAKAILFLTQSDYENLLGVITARHLNKSIRIIARADDNSTVTKLHRAGAELCVVPEVLAGLEIGNAVLNKVGR